MTLDNLLNLSNTELNKSSKNRLYRWLLFLLTTVRALLKQVSDLKEEVRKLNEKLDKSKIEEINKSVNQPTSKKPEWDKDPPKPNPKPKKPKRKKRRGSGNKSKRKLIIDKTNTNTLDECPDCGGDLSSKHAIETPSRIIEDIAPPAAKTIVSKEIQERKYCCECKKVVSSITEKALPKSDIGLNAVIQIAYLWVVPAMSLPNIQKFLLNFKSLTFSTSGIIKLMIRLANILEPLMAEILEDVKNGTIIWADETGWKVKGELWWLWIFANKRSAYYHPDKSRGSPVVEQILGSFFYGLLIVDGWSAYNKIQSERQACMSHIFRKIRHFVERFPQYRSVLQFYIKLKRIIRQGEKLQKERENIGEQAFARRLKSLKKRLNLLLEWKKPNPILENLIKKVRRQEQYVLSFVEHSGAPSHNNYGEYIIKKGVLKRKISGGSMSVKGFQAYACIQSIAQTCLLRGIPFHHFLKTTLVNYIKTGTPMSFATYESLHKD